MIINLVSRGIESSSKMPLGRSFEPRRVLVYIFLCCFIGCIWGSDNPFKAHGWHSLVYPWLEMSDSQ